MLDSDLAELYQVETKNLNKAVTRNKERFPADLMFQLDEQEYKALRIQSGTLDTGQGKHRKYLPYAFTEQGVAMLSGVLRGERAVHVNIAIMRAFVRLREAFEVNTELRIKLDEIEKRVTNHDRHLNSVFQALRQLMDSGLPPERKRIRPPKE